MAISTISSLSSWGVYLPPQDETEQQRVERTASEEKAREVSSAIDENIKEERAALKREKTGKPVKVLVLGQSESGKSTTIKNFQRTYAPKAWLEERASWAAVIRLNLVRHVNELLDVLHDEMSKTSSPPTRSRLLLSPSSSFRRAAFVDEYSHGSDTEDVANVPQFQFTEIHSLLRLRLSPMRGIQSDLEQHLGSGSTEVEDLAPFFYSTDPAPVGRPRTSESIRPATPKCRKEFSLSNSGWKSALQGVRRTAKESRRELVRKKSSTDETVDVLVECREDIRSLWKDSVMKLVLKHRGIRLEEGSGFFLSDKDLDRIASHGYSPSDNDVVRARLRTMGVQEHHFVLESTRDVGRSWTIYDVGGSRTSRSAWLPFFGDHVQAILFIVPLNVFDMRLVEDSRVNRLEDSYTLWKTLCSSELLENVQLILLLNKIDLLKQKLKRVNLRDYVPSYKGRTNDLETVSLFFKSGFKEKMIKHSRKPRDFRAHFTTVVDIKATSATLHSVQESILRVYLAAAQLL